MAENRYRYIDDPDHNVYAKSFVPPCPAGVAKTELPKLVFYVHIGSGRVYYRTEEDFNNRMVAIEEKSDV